MKKIVLLLVFIPVFLITALNFTDGNTVDEHPPYLKSFTCSSCHATIIDGIIINGKTVNDMSAIQVTIELPDYVPFDAVQVDVKGPSNPKNANFPIYQEDDYGTIYNINKDSEKNGKKSNMLTFDIPMKEVFGNNEIEIQGLLTNGDGTSKGDYSFSEKIILKKKISFEESRPLKIFPTIAHSFITIKNGEENSLISILDMSGKLVYQNTISNNEEVVDVSNFQNGYYFVKTANSISKIIVRK